MSALPRGGGAVMASRIEPPDSLDFFPTPPWAVRAFLEHMAARGRIHRHESAMDPACGEGHMAVPLSEFFARVHASDIFPYGFGEVADFLDDGEKPAVDWIITNPPFNAALRFVETALTHPAAKALRGVAVLCRLAWQEGAEVSGRYPFFQRYPPALHLISSERIPMHRGRWEPDGASATAYSWTVWLQDHVGPTIQEWIAPGARKRLTLPEDFTRFAIPADVPLFEGGAA